MAALIAEGNLVPYPFEETFATGLPADFAVPGGNGGVTSTWNEAEQAVDLVFNRAQNFWKVLAAEPSTDFWFEMDVEVLELDTTPAHFGFWLWTGRERYEGHRLCVWQGNWIHSYWEPGGTQTANIDLIPAAWAVVGARRTLRVEARRHPNEVWVQQILIDGEFAWRDYKRWHATFLPCIFGYGLRLRIHRVAGGTPSTLDDAPPAMTNRLLPRVLGHTFPLPEQAALQRYATRAFHRLAGRRNHAYAGDQRIVGTVKEKAVPNDRPVARRVLLFDERTHVVVRETWSDPVTGRYAFEEISPVPRYVVIAYDYQHNFRAVIADNLRAEPMPSLMT